MQREIEFRGISKETGKMIYGCFLIYDDRFYIVPTHYTSKDMAYYEVDIETVGQYTGLKDENEVKIFGGDILGCEILSKEYKNQMYNIVKYLKDGFYLLDKQNYGAKLNNRLKELSHFLTHQMNTKYVVVGNIHQNKELIK